MKSVGFQTLGCKVNYSETSSISRQFVERGFRVAETDERCDVFVLNTCSVTERADKECRQMVRRALRRSPDAFVVVIGCYAQLQPEEIASIDGVDLVLGAREKFNIFDHVGEFRKLQQTQIFVSCIDEPLEFIGTSSGETDGRTRAYLKVQDGCDYTCSFCTIPLARGVSRSQSADRIVAAAEDLARQGYQEIVLTGVNVGDYGKAIGSSFLDLLRALEPVPVDRFRISSIEPNLLTKDVVDFILSSERFCNHFHIPLQSGSDAVLRLMRRRYRAAQYRELVEYITSKDPSACIGADVLVGFPGETDELFEETRTFIAELPVSYLHVFTYSEREKTDAVTYANPVPMRIRGDRNETLRMIGMLKRDAFYRAASTSTASVLFETPEEDGTQVGWTRNYVRVALHADHDLSNTICPVKIGDVEQGRCTAALINTLVTMAR